MNEITDRQETELKYVLPNAAALWALASAAGGDAQALAAAAVDQVNHFFDTDERALRRTKLTLRLREEAGRYILTGKGKTEKAEKGEKSSFIKRKAEAEIELPAGQAEAILQGTVSPLEVLATSSAAADAPALLSMLGKSVGKAALHRVGAFRNRRAKLEVEWPLPTPTALTLELDETHYPGGRVDYEVELELPGDVSVEAAQLELERLLAHIGVEPQGGSSKASRFFKCLEQAAGR